MTLALSWLSPEARAELEALIDSRISEALAAANGGQWLTVAQAAAHVGLTERAIRRRVERGSIPCSRLGGRVLIERQALESLLRTI